MTQRTWNDIDVVTYIFQLVAISDGNKIDKDEEKAINIEVTHWVDGENISEDELNISREKTKAWVEVDMKEKKISDTISEITVKLHSILNNFNPHKLFINHLQRISSSNKFIKDEQFQCMEYIANEICVDSEDVLELKKFQTNKKQ